MNQKEQKLLNLLSMAQRAQKLASGVVSIEQAFRKHRVHLLLVAEDAAEETKKKYESLARKDQIPVVYTLTREILGQGIGKEFRAAAAVLDRGFGEAVVKTIEDTGKI